MKHILNLNFQPFPTLFTVRLVLREIMESDVESVFELRSNPIVTKALDKVPFSTINEAKEFVSFLQNQIKQQHSIRWAVCLKEDNKLIGCVGFHRIDQQDALAEIGYELLPHFHHKGIASEAITEALNYAFNTINLNVIEAGVNPENTISISLLHKFGFKHTRYTKADYFFNGIYLDSDYYSLSKNDYHCALME